MTRGAPPDGTFRFRQPIDVRFRDTDAMGHVNNAVYLTYFEAARAGYYHAVTGQTFEAATENPHSIIVAHARVEYRTPAFFGETLLVECGAAWVSRSSFALEYRVTAAESSRGAGRVVADGETVQVMFDYAAGRPTRLPEELRRQLTEFEGREIPSRPRD